MLGNSWDATGDFARRWMAIVEHKHNYFTVRAKDATKYAYRSPKEATKVLNVRSVYTRFGGDSGNAAPIISAIGFSSWKEDSAEMIAELLTRGGTESLRRFCARVHTALLKMMLIREMFGAYGGGPIAQHILLVNLAHPQSKREKGKKVMIVFLDDPTLNDVRAVDYIRGYYLREDATTVNVVQLQATGPKSISGPETSLTLTAETDMVVVGPIQWHDGVVVHSGTRTAEDLFRDLSSMLSDTRFKPQGYPDHPAGVGSIFLVGAQDSHAQEFCADLFRAMVFYPGEQRLYAAFIRSTDEASLVTHDGELVARHWRDAPIGVTQMITGDLVWDREQPDTFALSWDRRNRHSVNIVRTKSDSIRCISL